VPVERRGKGSQRPIVTVLLESDLIREFLVGRINDGLKSGANILPKSLGIYREMHVQVDPLLYRIDINMTLRR
jgi:hypothetical protein